MTKQKKSFFEKLTGIQKIDDESQVEITDSSEPKKDLIVDDPYEFSPREEKKGPADSFFQENDDFEASFEEETGEEVIAPDPRKEEMEPPVHSPEETGNESEVDSEGQLTIDVYQTDRDIVIKSTIAGVKPEDLDVDINSEMVTIKGKRTQDEEIDSENYYYQECYWGPFSRSIILPVEIVTEKAEASMKNGILTIKLPKLEVAKTRKLQVRGF